MKTRTGNFPVGFRRNWSDWQKDFGSLLAFIQENGFEFVDLGCDDASFADAQKLREAGIGIGSVDMPDFTGIITTDSGKRKKKVAEAVGRFAKWAELGSMKYFTVLLPEDDTLSPPDAFEAMYAGYSELIPALEKHDARIVIESYPGPAAVCCAPESLRMLFERCGAPRIGINYDPSHFIRMGIDPIRLLEEFKDRVYHVHAKDTELCPEMLYEVGNTRGSVAKRNRDFGEVIWRYTIPGHGSMRWVKAFSILKENGYSGQISIELEDENFWQTDADQRAGLTHSGAYLQSC